jgi:hypothetical protein
MHLTAQLKLQVTPEQADALRRTLEIVNAAGDYISECACESKTFRQFDLHKLCYRDVRNRFGLSAQGCASSCAKAGAARASNATARRTRRRPQ